MIVPLLRWLLLLLLQVVWVVVWVRLVNEGRVLLDVVRLAPRHLGATRWCCCCCWRR